MTLNGTLEDFSPAGILKVLSADARTGAVRFGGPNGCTVYLHRGQLYFARNEGTDEALATALVRPGRLTPDGWGHAIAAAGEGPRVGECLVRDGAIGADLLASVVLSVVYDPLIELFRDGTGEFDFEPDTVHWLGPFRAFPVDAIVGEVRKRVREVDEWVDTIPDLDVWVEANRTLPGNAAQVTILREDWELVTALTGPRTIRELSGELGRGCYSTARVVYRLFQAGLVGVVPDSGEADVVPIRRRPDPANVDAAMPTTAPAPDDDPLLAMGLPHRSAGGTAAEQPTAPAALTGPIGATVADGVDDETAPPGPSLEAVPDLADGEGADDNRTIGRWDVSRMAADGASLHHDVTAAPAENSRPEDPNAAWLADLYSQFIDDPESANGKKKRRGEPNPVDVAFKSAEQDGEAKVSTLKRLMGALRKL